jgi:RHS repeat-associated protein
MNRLNIKYVVLFIVIIFATNLSAQTTIKDWIGLPTDSTGVKLSIVKRGSNNFKKDIYSSQKGDVLFSMNRGSSRRNDTIKHVDVPITYSIDKTKDVGAIACSSGIAPTGAMTVTVPIDAYQSPDGYSPKLSLVYNSMGGYGPLGWGWNIAGISIITRGNKTIYYDNKSAGPENTKNDIFYVDGQRLITVSSTSSMITYQTEQGFIKACATLSNSSITGFIIYLPDGEQATYGLSDGANFYITKITDKFGNMINYTYSLINNYYRISNITYGKKNQASLSFAYTPNSYDASTAYISGKPIVCDYLLTSATATLYGKELRKYTLTYTQGGRASLLSQISCNAKGDSLNPLKFYYGLTDRILSFKNDTTRLMEWYDFNKAYLVRAVKGKFDYGTDNDGMIVLPNKISYLEQKVIYNPGYFKNQYGEDEKIFIYTGLDEKLSSQNPSLKTEKGFVDIFCMDLDKVDGEEIVKVNNYVSDGKDQIDFHVYTSNLYYGIVSKYTRSFSFNTVLKNTFYSSVNPKYYYTGDFNGDGKMEVLVVSANNALSCKVPTTCYLIDLENNKILYEGSPFSLNLVFPGSVNSDEAYNQSNKLYTFDYDGDGKTDLCLINDGGVSIYTFDNNGTNIICKNVSVDLQLNNNMLKDKILLEGEFNGDGKTDFILSPTKNNGKKWSIYLSTGNGYFHQNNIDIAVRNELSNYILQDINGDGQTDLIETYKTEMRYGYADLLTTYYITNQKSLVTGQNVYGDIATTTLPLESVLVPTNIQSRNYYSKLICLQTGGIVSRLYIQDDDSKNRLLCGVINSYGVINKMDFHRINENGYFYTKGYGADFPYYNFYGGLMVCTKLDAYHSGTLLSSLNYRYSNAVIHKQGLGFRGFEKINVNDMVTNRYSVRTFDPLHFSVLANDDSYRQSNAYSYSFEVASNKIAKVLLSKKVTTDKAGGVSATTEYNYDDYGNNTLASTDYGNGLIARIGHTYQNVTSNDKYMIGLTATERSILTRPSGTYMEGSNITYNANYLPQNRISVVNMSDKTKEENYEYDGDNRLVKIRTKYYSSTDEQVVGYSYDMYGELVSKTDPLGLTETYDYNISGLPVKITDHKKHVTSMEYDVLGRKIKTTFPDGVIQADTTYWIPYPSKALIISVNTSTGKPDTQTYFDALGHVTKTGEKCFDGQFLYTDKMYDSYGRTSKISYPYKTSPNYWKIYSYDDYDRMAEISYASAKRDLYTYSGLATTTVSDGISAKRTYNAMGDLLSVEDASGAITYNYRPDGQLSSVVAPGNVTTSFEYDTLGRQAKQIDPSAGTKTFAYDAAGNLNTETDVDGKVTHSTYDAYNRLIKSEYVGELSTDYSYNSDGKLVSALSNNGTGRNYTYDELFRIISEKATGIDGKWLQKNYAYNGDNISAIDYSVQSGHVATENYAYSSGNLSEIKLNNTTSIWKLTGENDRGLMSNYTTGILNRSCSYDMDGRALSITSNVNGTKIQDFSFIFSEETGNMSSRTDIKRNKLENFGYDNLNRLTSFAGQNIIYDVKGNITNFGSVGQFSYNSSKPYAVDTVIPSGNRIPLRNQTIAYNGLQRPTSIAENGYTANFVYNGDGDRVKMALKQGETDKLIRYYLDNTYESDQTPTGTKEKFYVGGDAYSAPAVLVKNGAGDWNIYYICRDNLGSITQITDASGNVVQELSYDAWGNFRNPLTHEVYATGQEPELFLGRGYTGHEHLAIFGLINMNARLYDPVLGRFLSPDPYIQMPGFGQNFNLYSYGLNNPLCYVDQNGEFFWIVVGVAAGIGAIINVATHWHEIKAAGGGWNSVWTGAGYFLAGGVAGGVGAAVGIGAAVGFGTMTSVTASQLASATIGFVPGATAGATGGAASGFLLNTSNSLLEGENIGGAFRSGMDGFIFGGIGGGLIGGISGGIESLVEGRDFWTGQKIQQHHSFPKFLGGDAKQETTSMTESQHKEFHKDLNQYLKKQIDKNGFDMYPRRGNPGAKIQYNFNDVERFDAIKSFYDLHPIRYWKPRWDFYRNNDLWKEWKPFEW